MFILGCVKQPTSYCAGGVAYRVRQVIPPDRDALVEMLGRCSAASLFRRFLRPVRSTPIWYADTMVTPHPGRLVLVAETKGSAIGVGELHDVGDGAELAMLVEDRYQGRGVGTRLLGCLVDEAARRDMRALMALVGTGNDQVMQMLSRVGPLRVEFGRGANEVQVNLRGPERLAG